MPTLEFKGKSLVYAHHLSVPFRELVIDEKKSLPAKGQKPRLDDNLIIHGDNLHALKALLPVYAGQIDCIYIDPPYNTGNEGWCYNDNVKSPLMQEWLKKVSPVDREDLERHDKWLSMMWPRLKLLHDLLAEDGVIFVSIDDNEAAHCQLLMDEVFGPDSFVACMVWKARQYPDARAKSGVSIDHEYVLVYGKRPGASLRGGERDESKYSNPDYDPRGPWMSRSMLGLAPKEKRPNLHYPIKEPKTKRSFDPAPETGWRYEPETMQSKIDDDRILFPKEPDGRPREKVFLKELQNRFPGLPSIISSSYTSHGTEEMRAIFGSGAFSFPKPSELVRLLVEQVAQPDSIILDSFAGSGTTAHAVLALNKKDGGNRKFILVECEDYADKLTAERVRRVIKGYKFEGTQREELLREPLTWTRLKKAAELVGKAEDIAKFEEKNFDKVTKTVDDGELVVVGEKKVTDKADGLGGSFTYCTLGPEMSLDKLLAEGLPTYEALAKYVFFTATGQALSDLPKAKNDLGYIGQTELYRVHLLYRPDPKWLAANDAALTETLVERMQAANAQNKRLLVFAASKFIGQRELARLGVEFCQLPFAIHRILGE